MAVLGSTSLTGCDSIPSFIAAASRVIFEQTSAPTSWTKDVSTHNNKALRVVTGTAAPGGSVAFTTALASQPVTGSISVSGTVGGTTLTTAQIPVHAHPGGGGGDSNVIPSSPASATIGRNGAANTGNAGSGGSHNHPFSGSGSFSGSAINLAVQYADVIICVKN